MTDVGKGRILIVDDDPESLGALEEYLIRAGFDVAVALDGVSVFSEVKILQPEIILLDVMLPDVSGLEVCRQLKAAVETRDIPVILMTAYRDRVDKVKGFESGAVDYLDKPINVSELTARIHTHLNLRNLQQKLETQNARLQEEIQRHQNAREKLKLSQKAAESAELLKSEFLTNMSHEIRTPLNAILGFTDILLIGCDPVRTVEYLDKIKLSGQGLLNMIDDILNFARLGAGDLSFNPGTFYVDELMNYIKSLFELQYQHRKLTFQINITKEVPDMIHSDRVRITQILMNLLSNSLKFTSKGGVSLSVFFDCETDMICFNVKDTGIGIPPERLETIFDSFTQVFEKTGKKPGGVGLGLAICKRLSDLMGGSIRVKSTPGSGSAFSVSLPAHTGEVEVNNITRLNALEIHQRPPAAKKKKHRILIVEDDIINREVFLEQFGSMGIGPVTVADNGKEGIRMAAEQEPDLVLMDIQMPVMNGNDAIRKMRENGYNGPIIVVSAHSMEEDIDESLQAGADGYITKPIDFTSFFTYIDGFLN